MILVNMVLGKCSCAWPYLSLLSQIKELLRGVDFQIRHVYREANRVANGLANQAVRTRNSSEFSGSLCLPSDVRLALLQDVRGMPVLRVKRALVDDDKG